MWFLSIVIGLIFSVLTRFGTTWGCKWGWSNGHKKIYIFEEHLLKESISLLVISSLLISMHFRCWPLLLISYQYREWIFLTRQLIISSRYGHCNNVNNYFYLGVIWPVEGMPILLRYVSYCLPLTMATTSLRSILTRGWNLLEPDVYLGFVSTISWIVLFLSISMAVLKFKRGWA